MRGTRSHSLKFLSSRRFNPAYAGNTSLSAMLATLCSVHPRVCGEHTLPHAAMSQYCGSSPRMRGTLSHLLRRPFQLRFIPAYAGNTFCPSVYPYAHPVHPRVCGEHSFIDGDSTVGTGSSPRMRGTRTGRGGGRQDGRFIPAYAGNTLSSISPDRTPPVHPRVCGEHRRIIENSTPHVGSSPRMRGTLPQIDNRIAIDRFIPAYAGNTAFNHFSRIASAVHPRVCGEHEPYEELESGIDGSSPRMRGTRQFVAGTQNPHRFIPAYAGNTNQSAKSSVRTSVHPRVCGEHEHHLGFEHPQTGSSPRMRGTLCSAFLRSSRRRFIPAYAGNTAVATSLCQAGSVHPRVCGEHQGFFVVIHPQDGSSPRMRGTHKAKEMSDLAYRFIPAYAGNTGI